MTTPEAAPSSVAPEPAAPVDTSPSASAATPESGPPPPKTFQLQTLWAVVAVLALIASGSLWFKLQNIQEQLARQSATAQTNSTEAKALAKSAEELVREVAAKQAVLDAKVAEVALQRTQIEELMQSLSRSRDENLVVDIESALRLAQQQAVLTGSVEPMIAALKSADQRISRAAQPRLNRVQRAINQDLDKLRSAAAWDAPSMLLKIDELVRMADEAPLANQAPAAATQGADRANARGEFLPPLPADAPWWQQAWRTMRLEAAGLLRISRIDSPEAALLTPDQGWLLRENLKLKLLNARLNVLARQFDIARSDLASVQQAFGKYFDAQAKKTTLAQASITQIQGQLKSAELPRLDETLAALTAAAAGR
jgi:uroporphyrin-3 C-methyltransferase